jgi:hypothetical protein
MTTRDLMRELRLLGQADIPKDSLERVWMRVLRECSTAEAVEAGATCPNIAAQGRARACPAANSFHAPAFGPGKTLPGLRPVLGSDTPHACPRFGSPGRAGGDK